LEEGEVISLEDQMLRDYFLMKLLSDKNIKKSDADIDIGKMYGKIANTNDKSVLNSIWHNKVFPVIKSFAYQYQSRE
jgi:hypothetical protein